MCVYRLQLNYAFILPYIATGLLFEALATDVAAQGGLYAEIVQFLPAGRGKGAQGIIPEPCGCCHLWLFVSGLVCLLLHSVTNQC